MSRVLYAEAIVYEGSVLGVYGKNVNKNYSKRLNYKGEDKQ